MKKIFMALVLLSTLVFAKVDVIEAVSARVNEMSYNDKVSYQEICVDGKLFISVIASSGVSITQVMEYDYSYQETSAVSCKNGK